MAKEHDALIAEYVTAWRACNTMNDPPDITYSGGWFTFKSPRQHPHRYRMREVKAMREVLRSRVSRPDPEDDYAQRAEWQARR